MCISEITKFLCQLQKKKKIHLKRSHHKKKNGNYVWLWVLTRGCDGHCAIYTHVESLCCIPKTNMLHVNRISIKKRDEHKD